MGIICFLFGHKPERGYAGGAGYFRISSRVTDGIGRDHAFLYCKCDRCEDDYLVGKIHLPASPEVQETAARLVKLSKNGFGSEFCQTLKNIERMLDFRGVK